MLEIEKESENVESNRKESENFSSIKLKKTLTFNEILCTSVLFLSAGFEATASSLVYVAYNLAMNQDVQEKLCKEIDDILEKHVRKDFWLKFPLTIYHSLLRMVLRIFSLEALMVHICIIIPLAM